MQTRALERLLAVRTARSAARRAHVKIAIYGTGPIGSAYALHLAKAGHEVTCIARGERLAQLSDERAIVTVEGERASIVPAGALDPTIAYDLVLVTVLAHKLDAILPALKASAARSIVFTLNLFEPLARLEGELAGRASFGFPAIVASLENGRLRHTIHTVAQKTIMKERRWAELFTHAGIATAVEPAMQAWLRTHAVWIATVLAMACEAYGRRRGLSFAEARAYARALRAGLALVERLGDSIRPTSVHLVRALPLSLVLYALSRTSVVKMLGPIGPAEARALIDAMSASAPEGALPALLAIRPRDTADTHR
ncbi:MAG: 2-dehydropantoate 2-reductase N-terminal domain-containing protein [Sandaracinus sp.]